MVSLFAWTTLLFRAVLCSLLGGGWRMRVTPDKTSNDEASPGFGMWRDFEGRRLSFNSAFRRPLLINTCVIW